MSEDQLAVDEPEMGIQVLPAALPTCSVGTSANLLVVVREVKVTINGHRVCHEGEVRLVAPDEGRAYCEREDVKEERRQDEWPSAAKADKDG